MQRQKSILSFLKKPSPENLNSGDASQMYHQRRPPAFPSNQHKQDDDSSFPLAKDLQPEVRGTDTPPEKPHRQVFCGSSPDDINIGGRMLSSIMQKFVKEDEPKRMQQRYEGNSNSTSCYFMENKPDEGYGLPRKGTPSKHALINGFPNFDLSSELGGSLDFESIPDDILEPETPAMRPIVPRLKRVQEDSCKLSDRGDFGIPNSSKRLKSVHDFGTANKTCADVSEITSSKFEWLNPSLIKDADGRRPDDALYNKRTLYIPPDVLKKMSASQKQYWGVKCQYMDVILFFKVGKFYELYELDAEIGHKELDWKMTHSGVGKCRQVGISENGIDDAVQKLIARGYKVGRVEQLETSGQAKSRGAASVIQRNLVRVYTPTTMDANVGPDAVHLLALKEGNFGMETGSTIYGFAFLDYASLRFWVGSICDDPSCAGLGALLMQVSPREVIYETQGLSNEAQKALKKYASAGSTALQMTPVLPGTDFMDPSEVRDLIQSKGYFQRSFSSWVSVLDGVDHNDLSISALGGLVVHLSRLMLDDALRNGDVFPYQIYQHCLRMDGQTLVNLEIFMNSADGSSSGTLYKYLDNCITSSGKRLLRNWICHPLLSTRVINDRLNVVEWLMKHPEMMFSMEQYLRRLPDLERLLGQVRASVGSLTILLLPLVGEKVLKQRVKAFVYLVKGLRTGIDLLNILQTEGPKIPSLSKILDLPLLSESGGLADVLTQFEVAVDEDFPQYKDHDVKDSDAETLAILVELFAGKAHQWSQAIYALSCVDVLRSFAVAANSSVGPMSRPVIVPHGPSSTISCPVNGGPTLQIKGLWHPYAVADSAGGLVPNDIYLGEDANGNCPRALLLTGPNMGGKSTLLRATCLAVILAQLGCYVPCELCTLSPADIIFTRLGATDRIMTGESTFFIECMETASVLHSATEDSLVLLDELGRGTSTFDGYAIAYAVLRHLVEKVHCRLLFATHYHPLTKEFASHPHVSLQHMACTFKPKSGISSRGEQELVFLYRLASGACPESYGLQVALMAGIPNPIVEAASTASQVMKSSIAENFKSSERRSEFSTLHEEWLKTLLAVSQISSNSSFDEDASDTLLCLWYELKSFHGVKRNETTQFCISR